MTFYLNNNQKWLFHTNWKMSLWSWQWNSKALTICAIISNVSYNFWTRLKVVKIIVVFCLSDFLFSEIVNQTSFGASDTMWLTLTYCSKKNTLVSEQSAVLVNMLYHYIIVYGPVTETLHPPGDFWRPLFLETLAIGLLKSGCLQKSQCWIKPWGRFFQNGRQISTNGLFLVLFFCISTIFIQFNEI